MPSQKRSRRRRRLTTIGLLLPAEYLQRIAALKTAKSDALRELGRLEAAEISKFRGEIAERRRLIHGHFAGEYDKAVAEGRDALDRRRRVDATEATS